MFELWLEQNKYELEDIFEIYLHNIKTHYKKIEMNTDEKIIFLKFCKMLYDIR
jgi:formylmethanofuran dehydrogenase subunit C